ncbi:hypothetical protein [Bradyrhizobium sp. SZCCHNS1012]|nr:hypothetical protein [Bradyrhizobium sp. SZCCHNS1012]
MIRSIYEDITGLGVAAEAAAFVAICLFVGNIAVWAMVLAR